MELIAWLLMASLGGVYFSTAKADIEDVGPLGVYKLGYTTPIEPGIFDFAFERTAGQLCPQGYSVADKDLNPNRRSFWLVSCHDKK